MPGSRAVLVPCSPDMSGSAMPALLGVTWQRCQQLAERADFRAPVQIVPGRRLWRREDVERWRDERWARPWKPARAHGEVQRRVMQDRSAMHPGLPFAGV